MSDDKNKTNTADDKSELKQLLCLLLKISIVWVFSCVMQFRFYLHLMTKDELRGTYYSPGGFVIPETSRARAIRNSNLICVIQPTSMVSLSSIDGFTFENVNITSLVVRNTKRKA